MSFKVLVYGDRIVDRYVRVSTSRTAQEFAGPVWDTDNVEERPGGADNVAENVRSLGGEDFEVGCMGIDYQRGVGWERMVKTRYADASGKIVFRCDSHRRFSDGSVKQAEMMYGHVRHVDYDALIVSDYDKGTVTENLIDNLKNIPVKFVDSKRKDLSIFKGFNVLKVNLDEYAFQCGNPFGPFESLFDYVVVTKGEKGAQLRQYDAGKSRAGRYMIHQEDFPVRKVWKTDVTGAGDTHTAAMLVEYLRTKDLRAAVRYANQAARIKVKKFGTSTVSDEEVKGEMR